MTEGCTPARMGSEIIPARVIGHEHNDVWFLVLRRKWSCSERNNEAADGQPGQC